MKWGEEIGAELKTDDTCEFDRSVVSRNSMKRLGLSAVRRAACVQLRERTACFSTEYDEPRAA